MKEFSIWIFHRCFTLFMHCIKGLKEMSVNFPNNVLAENYQYLLRFFSYSIKNVIDLEKRHFSKYPLL